MHPHFNRRKPLPDQREHERLDRELRPLIPIDAVRGEIVEGIKDVLRESRKLGEPIEEVLTDVLSQIREAYATEQSDADKYRHANHILQIAVQNRRDMCRILEEKSGGELQTWRDDDAHSMLDEQVRMRSYRSGRRKGPKGGMSSSAVHAYHIPQS